MRMALIETATGKVANCIELEPGANWQPPVGHHVQEAGNGGVGDTWDGVRFLNPPPPPPGPTAEELAAARAKAVSDAAAEVTAEIDKAFGARGLPLTDTEKARITGRQLNLIAKAQGR